MWTKLSRTSSTWRGVTYRSRIGATGRVTDRWVGATDRSIRPAAAVSPMERERRSPLGCRCERSYRAEPPRISRPLIRVRCLVSTPSEAIVNRRRILRVHGRSCSMRSERSTYARNGQSRGGEIRRLSGSTVPRLEDLPGAGRGGWITRTCPPRLRRPLDQPGMSSSSRPRVSVTTARTKKKETSAAIA